MNIDTLRKTDGTYRKASVKDIQRMLTSEHVCHIQTERGTIAIRPGRRTVDGYTSELGWTVDRATGGITDREQSKWFKRGEQKRLIRAVLLFLNGDYHTFEAGDDVTVWSNQAERDGNVLAVIGREVLVEYEMPAGSSALVLFEALGTELYRTLRNYPHRKLPKRWIKAIHEQGWSSLWIGKGQREHQAVPLPAA